MGVTLFADEIESQFEKISSTVDTSKIDTFTSHTLDTSLNDFIAGSLVMHFHAINTFKIITDYYKIRLTPLSLSKYRSIILAIVEHIKASNGQIKISIDKEDNTIELASNFTISLNQDGELNLEYDSPEGQIKFPTNDAFDELYTFTEAYYLKFMSFHNSVLNGVRDNRKHILAIYYHLDGYGYPSLAEVLQIEHAHKANLGYVPKIYFAVKGGKPKRSKGF
jgi:hypothetical protein